MEQIILFLFKTFEYQNSFKRFLFLLF
jgi:hypothetical protein